MSFVLRDYQQDMIAGARALLRQHQAVLIQAPTGAGKTALAAFMAGSAVSKGLRVWFVCHRDFLVDQTSKTFAKVGIDHAFIAAGWPFQPHKRVQICSIDTVKNRLDRLTPPDLVIWDEGHHTAAAGWRKVREWADKAKHVGLSATPCRLDGKGLDDLFQAMVPGPAVSWLIENKFLSDYRAYAPSTPDLSGVHTRAGDYAAGELDAAMNKAAMIGEYPRHYLTYARGLRAAYFATSVATSERIASMFRDAGVSAQHVDGTTPTAERKAICRRFALGEIQVITNCAILGEGFDLAAQAGIDVSIDCVGLARPTQSLSLHLQMIGRALRPSEGKKHAVILDHAGGLMKHGLPDDDREWSLSGQSKKKKAGDDPAVPMRQCPKCFMVHRPAPKCPECGHVYAVEVKQTIEEVEGELHEIDKEAMRAARKAEEAKARTLEDLIKLGQERGYKNPVAWAGHRVTARHAARQQRQMPADPEWAGAGDPKQKDTHCKYGHEWTAENTKIKKGAYKECRECNRISQRKSEAKKRGLTLDEYDASVKGKSIKDRKAATHCHKGHEFTDENTDISSGARVCLSCRREYKKLRYHKKQAALNPTNLPF